MRIRAAAAVAATLLFSGTASSRSDELTLEKAALLMRHSIRAPTSSERNLFERLTTAEWPQWEVKDGQLTPHGLAAATLYGAFLKDKFSSILPKSACPGTPQLYSWANSGASRTIATGDALLKGLYPDCSLTTAHKDQKDIDPMFWSYGVGATPLDPAKTKDGMLAAMGGSIDAARKTNAATYAAADQVIPCCHISFCEMAGLEDACKMSGLPWYIREGGDPKFYQLLGGPEMASTISEHIRMAYLDGKPLDQIGWGKIADAADVKQILELHRIRYDFFDHTPYVAMRGGSQLLKQILLELSEGSGAKFDLDRKGAFPDTKLLLINGHDTNLANVRAMIGVHWTLQDYPKDDTGPLGTMVFERLKAGGTGKRYIRLSYMVPRMDVIRSGAPMTGDAAPEIVALPLQGCRDTVEAACEINEAFAMLASRIDESATWDNDATPKAKDAGAAGR